MPSDLRGTSYRAMYKYPEYLVVRICTPRLLWLSGAALYSGSLRPAIQLRAELDITGANAAAKSIRLWSVFRCDDAWDLSGFG